MRTAAIIGSFALILAACSGEVVQPRVRTQSAKLLPGPPHKGVYIVVLKKGVSPQGVANAAAVAPLHSYMHALNGFAAVLPAQAVSALLKNPNVVSIEPDIEAKANAMPTGILRTGANTNATAKIDGVDVVEDRVDVDVAVIDTGIDNDHPDLNIAGGWDFVTPPPRNPKKAADYDPTDPSMWDDANEHGTHVAGTIGALDNGEDAPGLEVVGMAPGARLWAMRVLDANGSGSFADITAALDKLVEWLGDGDPSNDVEVANMSLAGYASIPSTCDNDIDCNCTYASHTAVCNAVKAGITVVVAASNEGCNVDDCATKSGYIAVPAAYRQAVTVSALADFDGQPGGFGSPTCRADEDDTLADFSNWGPAVDIMAPGVCILSTVPGGGYDGSFSGTSMASPHVAGGAALIKADNPGYTPQQVLDALLATGDAAPCVGGTCADDPDGIQEKLLFVGVSSECSDGVIEGAEQCEGADLGGGTCASQGFAGGVLVCSATCSYDTSGCFGCGDGNVDTGEECDGSNLGGATCGDLGFYAGTLGCSGSCTFDTSQCNNCGNGAIDDGEECDGGDLGDPAATCVTEGYDSGSLSCNEDCTINTSGCSNSSGPVCGNGIKEEGEACDGNDFGVIPAPTCADYEYDGGALSCSEDCAIDTSGCCTNVPIGKSGKFRCL